MGVTEDCFVEDFVEGRERKVQKFIADFLTLSAVTLVCLFFILVIQLILYLYLFYFHFVILLILFIFYLLSV